MNQSPIQVGDFVFDPTTGELARGDDVTRLRPQAARALAGLVRRPGALVTREELLSWIWPEGHSESDLGLNVCIQQVRSALEDDAADPIYIETLRARGYRLIAAVTPLPTSSPRSRAPLGWMATAFAGVLLTVLLFRPAGIEESTALRLAVIPFVGILGVDTVDYVRAGLVEDVITALAKNDPEILAVIAASSAARLASDGLDPLETADRLDADFILQGAIRSEQDGYHLTVRLLDVESTTYAWSEAYTLNQAELSSVDQHIVRGVIGSIPVDLGSSSPQPMSELANSVARDGVLRARFLIAQRTRADAEKALEFLDEAITLDSVSAEAWTERANAHLLLGQLREGEAAIAQARRFGDGHKTELAAGRIALYGRNNPEEAAAFLVRAVASAPGVAEIRHVYAQTLAALGELDEAVRQGDLALRLDPVSSVVRGDIGWVYYYAERFDKARATCKDALELVPESVGARICTLLSAHFEGNLTEEVPIFLEVLEGLNATPADVAEVTAEVRNGDFAAAWLWLLSQPPEVGLGAFDKARLHALLGQEEDAITALNEARAAGQPLLWVGVDPLFRSFQERLN